MGKGKGKLFEGREKDFLSREKWEKWIWFHVGYIYRNRNSMDRGAIEICQALNLDRYESIKVLLRICQRQKYLDRSRIYRPDRKFLDGSRSYRDKFQKARWIEYALTSVEKGSPRGSIDMNAKNKLLNHRSNQHVKLSKTSLNKKIQSIHDPKHTHTHTH